MHPHVLTCACGSWGTANLMTKNMAIRHDLTLILTHLCLWVGHMHVLRARSTLGSVCVSSVTFSCSYTHLCLWVLGHSHLTHGGKGVRACARACMCVCACVCMCLSITPQFLVAGHTRRSCHLILTHPSYTCLEMHNQHLRQFCNMRTATHYATATPPFE